MVSTRADLALDKRDIKAAIGIVERFLEAQPGSEDARIRLMEMQLAAGSGDRAVETARGGIRLRPQDPRWAERLGDLLEATGDPSGAATEYERAFSLDPKSMGYLEKAALARLNAGGAADTLALLRGANELVQRSPVLRAIGAAALARSGRRDDALVAGREALAAARAAKADDLLTAERTVLMLREMFPPEKPAEFEAYLTQAGAPSVVESALLADAWARSGPSGADKALEWCGKIEAQGESVPAGVRASAAMTRGGALYGKGDLPAATDAIAAERGGSQQRRVPRREGEGRQREGVRVRLEGRRARARAARLPRHARLRPDEVRSHGRGGGCAQQVGRRLADGLGADAPRAVARGAGQLRRGTPDRGPREDPPGRPRHRQGTAGVRRLPPGKVTMGQPGPEDHP
jgi:tetratricopeptide (TPR) repeat protein